jgi:hypothetical protein
MNIKALRNILAAVLALCVVAAGAWGDRDGFGWLNYLAGFIFLSNIFAVMVVTIRSRTGSDRWTGITFLFVCLVIFVAVALLSR